jgi:AcrR family transcriptional regulator
MSRRHQILRRATEIFERKGVANTSIEDIAKAIGVKREAIYYYFKSREDILLAIILPQSESLKNNLKNVSLSNRSSMEKLHEAIRIHLSSYSPGYLEMAVMLREKYHFKDTRRLQELHRIWRQYTDQWIDLIVEGQKKGEFDDELDAKLVAFGILGMCNWVSRWFDPAQDESISRIIDTFFKLSSKGLARHCL